MYPDAGGAREVIREMADRLATSGYVVLLPDIYYRAGGFEPFSMANLPEQVTHTPVAAPSRVSSVPSRAGLPEPRHRPVYGIVTSDL